MKKITIITVVALAAALSFGAAPTAAHTTNTSIRAKLLLQRAAAYVTNDTVSANSAYFFHPTWFTNAADIAKLDAILAAKPPLQVLIASTTALRDDYPLTFAAALKSYKQTKPTIVAIASKTGCRKGYFRLPAAERAAYLVETPLYHVKAVKIFRRDLGSNLAKLIVPTLRKQGKAVTTGPDGKSPVKEYADRITTALNAPRFAGLQTILDEMGIAATLDFSAYPTDDRIAAKRDAILAGQAPLTPSAQRDISVCFGTDAYNAFVEAYNGGAR